jgi:hypothetical protein
MVVGHYSVGSNRLQLLWRTEVRRPTCEGERKMGKDERESLLPLVCLGGKRNLTLSKIGVKEFPL